MRVAKSLVVLGLCGAVMFLALRSSPYLQYVPWMPRQLGVWADHHGVIRNTVAFFILGLATLLALRPRPWLVVVLCAFAALLEIAQRWIPGRIYDPKDIVASVAGILLAWPLAWAIHRPRAAR